MTEHEDICLRCGRCCHSKVIFDDDVIYTPFPCRYLDEETHLCTVYDHRWEANPDCLTLDEGIRLGVFPADCPYVKDIPGYVPPRMEMTEDEFFEWQDAREERRRQGKDE